MSTKKQETERMIDQAGRKGHAVILTHGVRSRDFTATGGKRIIMYVRWERR